MNSQQRLVAYPRLRRRSRNIVRLAEDKSQRQMTVEEEYLPPRHFLIHSTDFLGLAEAHSFSVVRAFNRGTITVRFFREAAPLFHLYISGLARGVKCNAGGVHEGH